MLILLLVFSTATLITMFWNQILEFLNTVVRDFLESHFGVENCSWFVNLIEWCDGKVTSVRRNVKEWWKKFHDKILSVKATYTKNGDNTYTKRADTLVRTSPTTGKRQVYEETLSWEYLPDSVRTEMIARRTKQAELDIKEVVSEKIRQRAKEDEIELVA